jgi:hypothetical protein
VTGRKRALLLYTGVFLVYSLLTLVMTWPVVVRLDTHLVGNGDDMWVHYWNNWWVKQVLQRGGDLYYTSLLFYPTGVSLLDQNFGWINIALWLVLEPLVGGIVAYNLVHLIHIPLCGLGMFALVRRLTKSDSAAFIGGLVFAFQPYRMLDTNHPNLISTEVFPVLMLALLRLIEDDRPIRDGVIVGILIALIGYMRWQLVILASFLGALYLLYALIWRRERWNRRTVSGLALMAVMATVLMGPGLYPLLREYLTTGLPDEVTTANFETGKQDIVSFLVPQYQHPLSAFYDGIFRRYASGAARTRYTAFVGHVVVGLIVVAAVRWRRKREIWFWLGLALLSFLLALGPFPRFDGRVYTEIPLPYRLIGWLPPVQMLRYPLRFNAALAVPVAVLAGYGALALRQWLGQRRWINRVAHPVVFACLLGLLLLVDYISIPTATVSARVPDFYITLIEEPGEFALVGLPGNRQATERYMFYQVTHGRPILGGHVSRLPPDALDFASSVPLIAGMYEDGLINTALPDVSRQLSLLADAGFRYVILHKKLAKPELVAEWQSYLVALPRYEDDEIAVYTTAPMAGEDFFLKHELGRGVGLVDVDLSTSASAPVLEFQLVWGSTAPPGADLWVELALVDDSRNERQVQCFEVSPTWPTGEWPANAIVRDRFSLKVDSALAGDIYTVVVSLAQEDGARVGQKAKVGDVVVTEQDLAVFPIAQRVEVDFADVLRLLGYNLEVNANAAYIALHWQALRQMDESYKFFVHLVDAESGALVAQADVVPRDWTYPTTEWRVEEIVSDRIVIPLEEVPPGRYRVWIGAYLPATGERLSIGDVPEGFIIDEGRLMLPEVVVR